MASESKHIVSTFLLQMSNKSLIKYLYETGHYSWTFVHDEMELPNYAYNYDQHILF